MPVPPTDPSASVPLRPAPRRFAAALALPLLLALLAACGDVSGPDPANGVDPDASHVVTLALEPGDSAASVEAASGGELLLFDEVQGVALLRLDRAPGDLATLSSEANADAVAAPEATGQAIHAWAGAIHAWAGGSSAWAGAIHAWAGGSDAWSAAGDDHPLAANDWLWKRSGLTAAHARSPRAGAGVRVAVVDTGVDLDHPALAGSLAPAWSWWDFVDDDTWPDDRGSGALRGHGTAVAGVILQAAPRAEILPLRALGPNGRGDLDDVINAVVRATHAGADVINLSLGSATYSPALEHALLYAFHHDVLVVASAGNTGGRQVLHPGAGGGVYLPLVTAGSIDADGIASPFSAYGDAVDLVTYGEDVVSLMPDATLAPVAGTSFAAPLVSGTLALALADGAHHPFDVVRALERSADDGIYPANIAARGVAWGDLGDGAMDADAFSRDIGW